MNDENQDRPSTRLSFEEDTEAKQFEAEQDGNEIQLENGNRYTVKPVHNSDELEIREGYKNPDSHLAEQTDQIPDHDQHPIKKNETVQADSHFFKQTEEVFNEQPAAVIRGHSQKEAAGRNKLIGEYEKVKPSWEYNEQPEAAVREYPQEEEADQNKLIGEKEKVEPTEEAYNQQAAGATQEHRKADKLIVENEKVEPAEEVFTDQPAAAVQKNRQHEEADLNKLAAENEPVGASEEEFTGKPTSRIHVHTQEDEKAIQIITHAPESDYVIKDEERYAEVPEVPVQQQSSAEDQAMLARPAVSGPDEVEQSDDTYIGVEQDEQQAAATREAEPAKKSKTIPFNVVMLKQDKKKLQNKHIPAKTNTSQKSTVLPIMAKMEHRAVKDARPEVTNDEGEDLSHMAGRYTFPSINLLTPAAYVEDDQEWLREQSEILNETLINFNVRARVVNVTQGPAVTRFEVQPEPGVKVNKVTNLTDDIKLSLAARDIRLEAPIPGKHTIGIEIPNRKSKPVFLREVLESDAFKHESSPLSVALGLDISGEPIVTDLRKMPHGLIAGATGSGKSVCINTMLVSLLYKASPQDLKLLLIDPKMVELAPYNKIPHLVSPVITDVKAATAALKWAVDEMERRYELFAHAGVRDINRFNQRAVEAGQLSHKLPLILIIIDELADLMMVAPGEVEEAICRIAQKARACGIHLILATQRPSVDVITGLIKANIPTRIAFSVSSQIDSRTIIDTGGAEKLLGRGDMLFAENGSSKTVRIQGTFVSDDEIDQVVDHVKQEQEPQYLFEQEELMKKTQVAEEADELFFDACEFVVNQNMASASSLQRRFHIGYNRAARLIEMMESRGIISEARGSKPRDVLISEDELEYINANTMA
ncbi:DNA translocase FtsK [Peribacillus deserti]|uniref:DNA translocase FtsK n=2 Tax=Peribacillus deserti TaxID=673318 RepID=A0A2N5MAW5_9BACI|nr:DNA translocase FtsK [Peribacillus deserti]